MESYNIRFLLLAFYVLFLKKIFFGGRRKGSHVAQSALTLVDSTGQLRISDPSTPLSPECWDYRHAHTDSGGTED